MNELQINVNQQAGVISTNFGEVKEALLAQMEVYKELEVTEENKAERKKDIATLRKMIKAVNDKRIEVKKECLKPYESFEKQATELVNIINEPVGLIDSQVKEYEDKQRLEKISEIDKIFTEVVGDLIDNVSLDRIREDKWENVATSLKSIKEDMVAKLNTIRGDISSLRAMQSDKSEEAVSRYFDNFDLSSAINFITRYEQQKKEIEQRMKEQQEKDREAELEKERERIRREEREALAREKRIEEETEAKVIAEQEAKEKAEREAMTVKKQESETLNYIYGISATLEEFEQIEMYLNSLGVEFERIG